LALHHCCAVLLSQEASAAATAVARKITVTSAIIIDVKGFARESVVAASRLEHASSAELYPQWRIVNTSVYVAHYRGGSSKAGQMYGWDRCG
jgi:hypothetical protein